MTETLTLEQENALSELRKAMKNELPTGMFDDRTMLCKFLIARNFNVKQAESMLRKNIRWRKEIQADTIVRDFEPKEVLIKYVAQSCFGFDKEGHPVRYIPIGNIDGKGLFKSANNFSVLKCSIQAIETDVKVHRQQSEKLGRLITKSVFLYDLANFTLAQATHMQSIQLFVKGISIFQDNYPELLKRIYIINASVYFTLVWPVIKSIMSNAMIEKIHVFGQDGWKEELLKQIDADVLPSFLGGKRTDPDGNPLCITFVDHGGVIPEKYYLVKNIEKMAQKPGTKFIKLGRQAVTYLPLHIRKVRSVINWEFETKSHDIGFGLWYERPNEMGIEEIIPVFKIETEHESENGKYRCENNTGKYIIVFDNSYSWFHIKELYYRTWITDINGTNIEEE